ncbi:MAG: hypothetical protein P4L51_06715 [Puia sp.]|nr:hypothetical protein [Puia sp.]
MNSLSLPIVHPAFEKLKRSGSWLHVAAGLLILSHAISHMNQPESAPVYFWCQLLISLDIFILVLVGRDTLTQLPRVNLFFRVVELLFFLGIGVTLLLAGNWLSAGIHLSLSIAYGYLLYCENKISRGAEEYLSFHHTGVTVPGIPESRFFIWTHINGVDAARDSIRIETSLDKTLHFDFRKNLDAEELEQIHEFCRHYLKSQ